MSAWWSLHLEELLSESGLERESRRGKRYLQEGRVRELHISPGRVSALLDGTRPQPYRVHLDAVQFDEAKWTQIIQDIQQTPGAWMDLHAGRLPDVARSWGVVPRDPIGLQLHCSCPVRNAICKHIVAGLCALAALSARDARVLLHWRGCSLCRLDAAFHEQIRVA